MQSVAVAIVHGIGNQERGFANKTIKSLAERTEKLLGQRKDGAERFCFEPVYWAPVLQKEENELSQRLRRHGKLGWNWLRKFMVSFVSDAIAYQPLPHRRDAYDEVHAVLAKALGHLAERAGPRAPLCVVAHSLGTVIASNFLYDLQAHSEQKTLISAKVHAAMNDTPIGRGETLTLFYTLGSPIALWSLRYRDFGKPIEVPAAQLSQYYPGLRGEWVNFYDRADVIGYPLKELNPSYRGQVTWDRPVRVGGMLRFWNPSSHTEYLKSRHVLELVAEALVRVWRGANPDQNRER